MWGLSVICHSDLDSKQGIFKSYLDNQAARKLTREVTKLLAEQAKATNRECRLTIRDETWTDVHSFYVLMGGFAFDTTDLPLEEKFLPHGRDQFTLSPKSFLFVARHEPSLLKVPSEAEIRNQSKGSAIMYIITLFGTVDFFALIVFRLWESSMTISLLELTVFAFLLCDFPSLGFWWNKPLDIEVPTLVRGPYMKQICALTFSVLGYQMDIDEFAESDRDYLAKKSFWMPSSSEDTGSLILGMGKGPFWSCADHLHCTVSGYCNISEGQQFGSLFQRSHNPNVARRFIDCQQCGLRIHQDDLASMNRWNLIAEGFEKYLPDGVQWENIGIMDVLRPCATNCFPNIPSTESSSEVLMQCTAVVLFQDPNGRLFLRGMWSTIHGLIFGGILLLAWHGPFPSQGNRTLWRISAIINMSAGPTKLLHLAFWEVVVKLNRQIHCLNSRQRQRKLLLQTIRLLIQTVTVLLALLGPSSRIFIFYECFYSLSSLPDSAFKQPRWLSYIPYFQ